MSPIGQVRGGKPTPASNLYTVVLAAAFCIMLAAAVFVAAKCYLDYGTVFKIP